MKHNYALGIKKIIILWIVVFLGGYVLNSFFKKINSLDEGLVARSIVVPPGFQVEYNGKKKGKVRNNTKKPYFGGIPSIVAPVSQIKVSMIANNTPAPASVSGASNKNGCAGPRFPLTGSQMTPGTSNRPIYIMRSNSNIAKQYYRKLSFSECQMLKREEECRTWIPVGKKGWDVPVKGKLTHNLLVSPRWSSDKAVLPVVSFSKHGMGCVIVPENTTNNASAGHNYDKKVGYRIVWNVGCKGSTSDCGGRPTGANWGQVFSQHTPPKHTRGPVIIQVATSAISTKSKNYNKRSNWDKWYIPIEAGDGIPRKKKAPPPPPKPKPKAYSGTPLIYGQANYKGKVLSIGGTPPLSFRTYSILQLPAGSGPTAFKYDKALFPSSWKIAKGQTVFFRVRTRYGGTNGAIHILWMLRGTVPDATKTPGFANVVNEWNYLKRNGYKCWMDMNKVLHTSNTLTPAESADNAARQYKGNNQQGTGSLRAGVAAGNTASARRWINQ